MSDPTNETVDKRIPWGKAVIEEGRRLSLLGHALDVAAVFEGLMAIARIRQHLARAGGLEDLSPLQVARLTWIVACHDLGKLSPSFQAKAWPKTKLIRQGHIDAGAVFLIGSAGGRSRVLRPLLETLTGGGGAPWKTWTETDAGARGLLGAALFHHGRITRKGEGLLPSIGQEDRWKPREGYDPVAALGAFLRGVTAALPEARTPDAGPPLPAAAFFQQAFLGLVTLADWIGSDTTVFPIDHADAGPERLAESRQRARAHLRALGVARAWEIPADRAIGTVRAVNPALPEAATTPIQAAMVALGDNAPAEGSLVVLESATGSGKTEAALLHFAALHRRGLVDGLYLALPTRSSASAMRARLLAAARALFGADHPPVVLAVPGYFRVNDAEGHRLGRFDVLWHEEETPPSRWLAENPKRYLAAPLAVGTVDQVLMGTLASGHAPLRYMALSRLLLVVDEVHASDAYMTRLLRDAVERHRRLGGHVLLMSATLGAAARNAFLGLGAPPSVEAAAALPYPLISPSWTAAPALPTPPDRRPIRVTLRPESPDPEAIAARALGAARLGQRVLVVRNTVSDAVALLRVLERQAGAEAPELFRLDGVATLHHGRFAVGDRMRLDTAVEERFGRTAPRTGGLVLVGTQTLEQSLDLDADLLITDLCPMDVLLQRLGRLWRHDRTDRCPAALAEAVILTPAGEGGAPAASEAAIRAALAPALDPNRRGVHGLGSVYENLLALAATWELLAARETLVLPRDNRFLVEAALHPQALEALATRWGGAWMDHWMGGIGRLFAQRGEATRNLLDDGVPFHKVSEVSSALGGDPDSRAKTRLGLDSPLLTLDPPLASPFGGEPLTSLALPGWMAQGRSAKATGRTLGARIQVEGMDRDFRYDRLGLRFWDEAEA
jgi:CRISPR-associated endonuclease/helicase Cas3